MQPARVAMVFKDGPAPARQAGKRLNQARNSLYAGLRDSSQ